MKEALSLCEEALALVPGAHHPAWPLAASCQLQALIELGRAREAQQLGRSYLRMAEQERLILLRHWVEVPLADAEASKLPVTAGAGAAAWTTEPTRMADAAAIFSTAGQECFGTSFPIESDRMPVQIFATIPPLPTQPVFTPARSY